MVPDPKDESARTSIHLSGRFHTSAMVHKGRGRLYMDGDVVGDRPHVIIYIDTAWRFVSTFVSHTKLQQQQIDVYRGHNTL